MVAIEQIFIDMNAEVLNLLGVKFETREEYAIEYLEVLLDKYETVILKLNTMQRL